MTDTDPLAQPLAQLSNALAARVAAAQGAVIAIRVAGARHRTGTLWRADLVVASEQSLPKRDAFELVLPNGAPANATLIGRDPGTNIALLRLAQPVALPPAGDAAPRVGELVIAVGADGAGGASARLGMVRLIGPEWHSQAGGRIDRRIVLDIRLGPSEEGGPVFTAAGARLGISTLGPRGQVLVIPAATIESVVPALLKDGRVARGWLGVAFQPVAVPDGLQGEAGQSAGLMVLSVVGAGPAAKAGIIPGDILLGIDGTPASGARKVAAQLGADSVGRAAELRLLRGGALLSLRAVIEARPAA